MYKRQVYGQAVVRPVPRVNADDVVVAFHIFPPLVFLIAAIGPHTRNGKILPAAVQRSQPVVLAGDRCVYATGLGPLLAGEDM